MIPLFEFLIDKEANFAYWAQLLLGKWSWYFEKDNSLFFQEEAGILSNDEKKAFKKFKKILLKDGNQYRWLWERYDNLPINNLEEKKEYLFIRKALENKFNEVWKKELSNLKIWKTEFEKYDFKKLNSVFKKISVFLGIKDDRDSVFRVRTKLFISGSFSAGSTRQDFKDLIILKVSRASLSEINRVLGVAIHEFTHLINNKTNFITSLIKTSTLPEKELTEGYKWKYIIAETILRSIVSGRANTYIGPMLDFSEQERQKDEDLSYKKPLKKYSYEFLIRIAAFRVLPTITDYFNAGKVIDMAFMEIVIKTLLDLLRERECDSNI